MLGGGHAGDAWGSLVAAPGRTEPQPHLVGGEPTAGQPAPVKLYEAEKKGREEMAELLVPA